jgi:hypothetical protein
VKLVVVATCIAAISLFGFGSPAYAWNCEGLDNGDVELSPACQAAAYALCKVVAKGQPCVE